MLKSDFGFTYEQLYYDLSWQNIVMISSCVPSYDFNKKGNTKQDGKKLNGNDPKNKEAIDRELELLG